VCELYFAPPPRRRRRRRQKDLYYEIESLLIVPGGHRKSAAINLQKVAGYFMILSLTLVNYSRNGLFWVTWMYSSFNDTDNLIAHAQVWVPVCAGCHDHLFSQIK
jgi:hypothetical protein